MTVQEANDWLIELKDSEEIQEFYYADNFKEALQVAIESMEKQIPKKPLKVKGECFARTKEGKGDYEVILLCPNCREEILVPPFPCTCGQLIDWIDFRKLDWEEGGTSD